MPTVPGTYAAVQQQKARMTMTDVTKNIRWVVKMADKPQMHDVMSNITDNDWSLGHCYPPYACTTMNVCANTQFYGQDIQFERLEGDMTNLVEHQCTKDKGMEV